VLEGSKSYSWPTRRHGCSLRINIWIIVAVLLALLATIRLLQYQHETAVRMTRAPRRAGGELRASRIGASIRGLAERELLRWSIGAPDGRPADLGNRLLNVKLRAGMFHKGSRCLSVALQNNLRQLRFTNMVGPKVSLAKGSHPDQDPRYRISEPRMLQTTISN